MSAWIDVAQARGLPGLRLVLTAGVPGPWGEAAKGLFFAKGISYTRVRQSLGEENAELRAWTGFDNAPQAVWEKEPARLSWESLIYLAERLAPEPALVPAEAGERARMFGLIRELAGENGLGWSRRLMLLHTTLSLPESVLPADHPTRLQVKRLGEKYGYGPEAVKAAPARVAAILKLMSDQLAEQQRRGRRFLVGDRLERPRHPLGCLRSADLPASRAALRDAGRSAQRLRGDRPGAALRLLAGAVRAPRPRLPRASGAPGWL